MAEQDGAMLGPDGKPVDLVLYKLDGCPFCVRVMECIDDVGLSVPTVDVRSDPGAYAELVDKGGKTQVPCLFINGEPLYESADIVRFLQGLSRRPSP